MNNLTKYEGHTPGTWGVASTVVGALRVDGDPRDGWVPVADMRQGGNEGAANARLIADAPLLLAEVRRLREENEQQRKTIERYAQWDAQRQRNVDLAAQLTALRQSHARLLKEMYFQRERWVLLKQVPDDPGDQAVCAIRNLDAAVAEAEAL